MIVTTNMYFLLMLDPKDTHVLLADGPYWRQGFSEGSESRVWTSLRDKFVLHHPERTTPSLPHAWEIAGGTLSQMAAAGYGGQSTCGRLLEFAVHALLVRSSFVSFRLLLTGLRLAQDGHERIIPQDTFRTTGASLMSSYGMEG